MPESNLPSGTADSAPLSFDEGVDALLDFDSDAPNLEEAEATEETAETPELEAEAVDAEDPDATGEEQADGSEEPAGGRFVSGDAKFRLSDGTVISVADLARNNLFQRDYTRKTTELKQEESALHEAKSKVGEVAQALAQQRDFLLSAAQAFLPKAPDRSMMETDPFGYVQAKAAYDEQMQVISQLHYQKQSETGRMTEAQKEQMAQKRQAEASRLLEAVPEWKDQKVYSAFWNDAVETMAEYGFTPEELQATDDHRMYLAMRDLARYRKARKQAPKVQQDLKNAPKLLTGGKRMDPKAKISREAQGRSEALRKTGSFEAAVAALEDFV